MQESRRVAHPPRHAYWLGMVVGSVPFLLVLGIFILGLIDQKEGQIVFDPGIHLALYLYGTGILATVICLLIKQFRQVGAGLFTSLFFTPVILLALGIVMVFILGPVF
jgi:uncharacterized membrane protein YhaH (DUF805 family)